MKTSVHFAMSYLLVAIMVVSVTQSVPQSNPVSASTLNRKSKLQSVRDGNVKSGPDVAARVLKLK